MTVLSSNQKQPKKILLVEDDQILRDLYTELLSNEGYFVDQAKDGEQGLRKMKKGGYDLVLLNVILPKVDGLQIVKQLKKNPPKTENKKIVLLTNLSMESIFKEMGEEIDGYLIKSDLTPDKLIKKVRKYLE